MSLSFKHNRGITTVEAVVAIAVLAVALIPILGIFQGSLTNTQQNDQTLQATNLARMRIEAIKGQAYTSVSNVSRRNFTVLEDPDQQYQFSQAVTVEPSVSANPSYREVRIDVFKQGGTSPVVSLSTYLVDGGI